MPEYAHVLIASDPDFVPQAGQIVDFLRRLDELGAAPLKPSIVVMTPGEMRSVPNPFKPGEFLDHQTKKSKKVASLEKLESALKKLPSFDVYLPDGKGPPKTPPLEFDEAALFGEEMPAEYAYELMLSVRDEPASTSDPHDGRFKGPKPPFFGKPCPQEFADGVYLNPSTGKIIRVPGAGRARFWIEFQFGKSLFPKAEKHLDVIEPSILKLANEIFGKKFLQGCNWCE